MNADPSPGRADGVEYLLGLVARMKSENAKLRRETRELRRSRDHWREEARNWKWGALRRSA